jgi:molybdopterin synthase sulfur carrier subunit
MARLKFTRHLVRFFPDLGDNVQVDGQTVAEVITNLDRMYPGLAAYIVNERGALRRHVNIFLGQELIHDRQRLQDPVGQDDQIYIFQALSGGSK